MVAEQQGREDTMCYDLVCGERLLVKLGRLINDSTYEILSKMDAKQFPLFYFNKFTLIILCV